MGEYVDYLGESYKVGTCENLYYVTFQSMGEIALSALRLTGNAQPHEYMNEQYGWRYRFPFPDEDNDGLFKNENGFSRYWPVPVPATFREEYGWVDLGIVQQKQVEGKLWIVVQSDGKKWSLDAESAAELAEEMLVHAETEDDFTMVSRLVRGYMAS
jgi:hypothetical protein